MTKRRLHWDWHHRAWYEERTNSYWVLCRLGWEMWDADDVRCQMDLLVRALLFANKL